MDYIINEEHKKIIEIIEDIKTYDKNGDIENMFLNGYCYDFARMIKRQIPSSKIYFIKEYKHYVVSVCEKLFDVTGDVTEKYFLCALELDICNENILRSYYE